MKQSNNYWQERIEREKKAARKRTIKQTKRELRKLYEKQSQKLYNELLSVLSKIEQDSTDGKIYINDLYRTNRIYELIEYFNKTASKIGAKQIKLTERALVDTYKHAQEIVGKEIPESLIGTSFTVPSAVDPTQIVNQAWCVDGLDFKSRIWKNKQALVKDLSTSLGDYVMRGKGSYEIARAVASRLGVDEYNAYRLVRTETAHAQIQAETDKYKEYGFTHGFFKATDPCDDCGKLNGQRFTLEELSHMIPQHPNCECSFLLEVQDGRQLLILYRRNYINECN